MSSIPTSKKNLKDQHPYTIHPLSTTSIINKAIQLFIFTLLHFANTLLQTHTPSSKPLHTLPNISPIPHPSSNNSHPHKRQPKHKRQKGQERHAWTVHYFVIFVVDTAVEGVCASVDFVLNQKNDKKQKIKDKVKNDK